MHKATTLIRMPRSARKVRGVLLTCVAFSPLPSHLSHSTRNHFQDPHHEPGPNDGPGPRYESYGSSFGNLGPLPGTPGAPAVRQQTLLSCPSPPHLTCHVPSQWTQQQPPAGQPPWISPKTNTGVSVSGFPPFFDDDKKRYTYTCDHTRCYFILSLYAFRSRRAMQRNAQCVRRDGVFLRLSRSSF